MSHFCTQTRRHAGAAALSGCAPARGSSDRRPRPSGVRDQCSHPGWSAAVRLGARGVAQQVAAQHTKRFVVAAAPPNRAARRPELLLCTRASGCSLPQAIQWQRCGKSSAAHSPLAPRRPAGASGSRQQQRQPRSSSRRRARAARWAMRRPARSTWPAPSARPPLSTCQRRPREWLIWVKASWGACARHSLHGQLHGPTDHHCLCTAQQSRAATVSLPRSKDPGQANKHSSNNPIPHLPQLPAAVLPPLQPHL